jgi:hypothetical protein
MEMKGLPPYPSSALTGIMSLLISLTNYDQLKSDHQEADLDKYWPLLSPYLAPRFSDIYAGIVQRQPFGARPEPLTALARMPRH